MFKVSAQHSEGDSDEGPQGIPVTGTAELYTVSQEPGEGQMALTFSLSPLQILPSN